MDPVDELWALLGAEGPVEVEVAAQVVHQVPHQVDGVPAPPVILQEVAVAGPPLGQVAAAPPRTVSTLFFKKSNFIRTSSLRFSKILTLSTGL